MTTSNRNFKKKYDNDPEFREKHLSYLKEKIECPGCGRQVIRCNLTRHKQTSIHMNNLINTADVSELEKQRKKTEREYNKKIKLIKLKKQHDLNRIDNKIRKRKRSGIVDVD